MVAVTAVVGYSSGAPDVACSTITPGHGTIGATGLVPFNVNISSLDGGYIPGQTYTSQYITMKCVTLFESGDGGRYFSKVTSYLLLQVILFCNSK